ncbi:MAG: hypothetical protein PHU81_02675 [Acidobacteriota bacterium]|nr:hypothetical protein [Acidobacteriota bacterium]
MNNFSRSCVTFLAVSLLAMAISGLFSSGLAQEDGQVKLAPGVEILLPEKSQIKINWVMPPVDSSLVEELRNHICFSIDADGFPWLGAGYWLIINPVKQYTGMLSVPFNNFIHVGNGAMLIATDDDFGFIAPEDELNFDQDNGLPVFQYQPVAFLPGEAGPSEVVVAQKMMKGDNCLYFVVEKDLENSEVQKKYEVYCLQPEKIQEEEDEAARNEVQGYRLLYVSDKPVEAVAGNGKLTFVAQERVVLKITTNSPEATVFYEHPAEPIKSLDYSGSAGLFYTAGNAVGVLAEKAALEFIKAPEPEIFLKGDSLYVMLSKADGIIQVENVHLFKQYNKPWKELAKSKTIRSGGSFDGLLSPGLRIIVLILLLVVLIDVLKNQFPGYNKTIWLLLVVVGFLAQFSVNMLTLIFGLKSFLPGCLMIFSLVVILLYFTMGRKERIKKHY